MIYQYCGVDVSSSIVNVHWSLLKLKDFDCIPFVSKSIGKLKIQSYFSLIFHSPNLSCFGFTQFNSEKISLCVENKTSYPHQNIPLKCLNLLPLQWLVETLLFMCQMSDRKRSLRLYVKEIEVMKKVTHFFVISGLPRRHSDKKDKKIR